ncbi:MAG: hypothetical protein L3J56_01000 [Bacteroidales bacterium]|nr:hypothetical protein [Bacteroidales bacterium]
MDYKKFKKAKEIESKIKTLIRERDGIISAQKQIFQKDISFGFVRTENIKLFNSIYDSVIAEINKGFSAEINKLEKEFEKI